MMYLGRLDPSQRELRVETGCRRAFLLAAIFVKPHLEPEQLSLQKGRRRTNKDEVSESGWRVRAEQQEEEGSERDGSLNI